MKLVFWLCILVVMLNLLAGDARVAGILSLHRDYMVTLRYLVTGVGAFVLTLMLMRVLFADFANHTLPDPPPESESAETPVAEV